MSKITILGTGNALVSKCYNTCFTIDTPGGHLLVDAGGGNGILSQLAKAGISVTDIHYIYITHTHTDHILGVVWLVRIIGQLYKKGKYTGQLHIYGHDRALYCLRTICEMLLQKKSLLFDTQTILHEIHHGETVEINDISLTAFDIYSKKEKQFGFRAILPDGKTVVCLGDEPFNELDHPFVHDADWLLCEAFCLYSERDEFKPYEKNHSTALDAGRLASSLGVKNLVLYHTEEKNLDNRKTLYTEEAAKEYSGNIFVPYDLETIDLE